MTISRLSFRRNGNGWHCVTRGRTNLCRMCHDGVIKYVDVGTATNMDVCISKERPSHRQYFPIERAEHYPYYFNITDLNRYADTSPWPDEGMDVWMRQKLGLKGYLWVEVY